MMRGAYFFEKLFPASYPKSNSLHFQTACTIIGEELGIQRPRVTAICEYIRKTYQAKEHLMTASPDPPHRRLVQLVSLYGSPSPGTFVLNFADVLQIIDVLEEGELAVVEPVIEDMPRERAQRPIEYVHSSNQAARYILLSGHAIPSCCHMLRTVPYCIGR